MRKIKEEKWELFLTGGRFETVTQFVKENQEDVFLGVRDNRIDLYTNGGGCFLRFGVGSNVRTAKIHKNYLNDKKNENEEDSYVSKNLAEAIKKEKLKELKEKVEAYYQKEENTSKEEKLQEKKFKQKIIRAINTNSDFYAYDIEYRFNPEDRELKEKLDKIAQPDLLLMSKPNSKGEVVIYLMEVKYGSKSFAGAKKDDWGSGIVGHIGKTVELLKLNKENDKVRKHFEEEAKGIMKFYKKLELIQNKNFQDIDYDKIKVVDIQYGFIFGRMGQ